MGISSSRLRFSNRKLDRNVSTSEIEVGAQGDSNSPEGDFEAKERRPDGAPRGDAPTEIRTPVLALKGLRPSPLDDGGELRDFTIAITVGQGWDNYTYFAEYLFPIFNQPWYNPLPRRHGRLYIA